MKKFKLPIIDNDGGKKYIDCEIDVTLKAQLKWESEFSAQAENEDIFSYIERIGTIKTFSAAKIVSALKAIYCFIEINGVNTFDGFLNLFKLSDAEYLSELVSSLSKACELIITTPSSKN